MHTHHLSCNSQAMADLICEGPITRQHLEKVLQEYFKTNAKLISAKGEVISKGLGFTSDIMRVNCEWDVKNGFPTRVIAKAPKIENISSFLEKVGGDKSLQMMEDSAAFVPHIHETECNAYKLLSVEKPLPLPIIYGAWSIGENNPGLIVMEDMGERAGIVGSLADGLTLNQWRSVLECLADLHAWSLTTKTPWRDQMNDMKSMEVFFKNFDAMFEFGYKQITEKYAEHFPNVKVDLMKKELAFENLMEKFTSFQKLMPEVVQHGDTWSNNIMFEKNHDGTLGDKVAAFIDWQMCIRGSPVHDMARIESWCLNHRLRREHGPEMLRHYYDRLKSKAGDKMPLSFDQIKKLHDEATAINGLMGCLMVDFLLQHIAKVDEDPTGFRKKELLQRIQAGMEDAEVYYGWNKISAQC